MLNCERTYGSGNCERSPILWYQKCRPGYTPFGCCLCRQKPPIPPGWVKCGLGAANDRSTCVSRIKAQIGSVFAAIAKVAGLIASAGTSAAADEAADVASQAGDLFEAFNDPASAIASASDDEDVKNAYELASKAKEYGESINEAVQAGNKAQAARAAMDAAAIVDPTGLVHVAAEFTYPKCSPSF